MDGGKHLYEGSRAEAIVMVAYALVKAKTSFLRRLDDFGERLGPVVGVIGNQHDNKVHDNAKVRRPNHKVIKYLLSTEAEILTSKDQTLIIIKMKSLKATGRSMCVRMSLSMSLKSSRSSILPMDPTEIFVSPICEVLG